MVARCCIICIAKNYTNAKRKTILGAMLNTDNPNSFIRLTLWAGGAGWRRHVAALLAGWLALVTRLPQPRKPPAQMKHILLGATLLILSLFAMGPVLGALAPVFNLLGKLSLDVVFGLFALLLTAWRYYAGLKIIRAIEAEVGL